VSFVRRKISLASPRGSNVSIAKVARSYLQAIRKDQPRSTSIPRLLDWIEERFPEFDRFDYFAPYADAFERAAVDGGLRLSFAAPPQHGKSTVTLLGLLWLATFYPGIKHAYVTYNQTRAEDVAKEFRRLAQRAGMIAGGTLGMVDFAGDTSVLFTSVKGGITGYTVNGVCVIDDPIKSAREAKSPTVRADAVGWYKQDARTRRHPRTSYIAMATRWHIDDLPGYLVREQGFQYLNLKAVAEPTSDNDTDAEGRVKSDPLHRFPGESLWKRKPPEFFREERSDLITWYAMYQGEPRPTGGEVFRAPAFYKPSARPDKGYRVAVGVDLAYSKKTSADHSVAVEVWAIADPKLRDYKTSDGKLGPEDKVGRPVVWFYVVEVQRKQVDAPAFTLTLKSKKTDIPAGSRFFWYAAGTEKGAADFIKKAGIPLTVLDPKGRDKLMRAQRTAQLWNMGRIMLPQLDTDEPGESSIEWVTSFEDEVTSFTGVNDLRDDQVDGLVPAIDQLEKLIYAGDGPLVEKFTVSDR
jgi:hypothetical protein